jgi:tRNA(Ile)-lysidine synthase
VFDYIRKHDLLQAGDRVGVAASGGADSVALLRILLELRRELGIVLSTVHLNHKLRAAESDADEQFVCDLAAGHDLPIISESCDVKSHAAKNKLSLETAARELRYEFFRNALAREPLNKIATAHTIDDQAETVLLKMARGAGTRGLAGIYPKISSQHSALSILPGKAIVRPFLGTQRSEIEAYLREIGQSWREDSSNRELRHMRNRMRHEILPSLERDVNPRVREALAEAAEVFRGEEEFWSHKISELLPQVWTRSGEGGTLNWSKVEKLGLAVQRRVLRAAAESLGLNLEFRHVEDLLALSAEGNRVVLPGGWSALRIRKEILFERGNKEPKAYSYTLQIPGKVAVPEAKVMIEAVLVSAENELFSGDGLLDRHRAGDGLTVRNWQPGDRFNPPHAREPKKIKELLQDRHITGYEKKLRAVVANGSEVVWVSGLGVDRRFQAKGRRGVQILESPLR